MKQPDKWKETIDPYSIKFNKFKLVEVLGYPHARNDVFYCKGVCQDEKIYCFIKYASTKETDIKREYENILRVEHFISVTPKIIDYDKSGKFIVTREIEGERLSYILSQNPEENSMDYMFEYGKALAQIHKIELNCEEVKHRKFFDIPSEEYLKENEIAFIYDYLKDNEPKTINKCFCHGDFHYANILWREKKLVGVLDWELSGIGNKEFDIAWAIINRPSQKFLKTEEEVQEFLRGYERENCCEIEKVKYYMILIYSYFISVDDKNKEYKDFVKAIFKNNNQSKTSLLTK